MGGSLGKILSNFAKGKPTNIVMVGLDNAGKTSLLYKLKVGNLITTIPTIGYNLETIQYKKLKFFIRDVGGQDKIRPLWKDYCNNEIHGLIFVVDSTDSERLGEASEELENLLQVEDIEKTVLLVFANKQDKEDAINVEQIAKALNLANYSKRKWSIQAVSAQSGTGLNEGMDWLSHAIAQSRK